MTKDQTANQAAATDETSTETTSNAQQPVQIDLNAYAAALDEFTKNDENASGDLQIILAALNAHAQVLAQLTGVAIVFFDLGDGRIAAQLVQLQQPSA